MKTIDELKQALADAVTTKCETTRDRREYKRTRVKISNTPDFALMRLWYGCRNAKAYARCTHLALCMARGRRYWECERNTYATPSAYYLAKFAGCTKEEMQAWLDVKPSAEELAAWNEHVERSKVAARAAKAAGRLATAAE